MLNKNDIVHLPYSAATVYSWKKNWLVGFSQQLQKKERKKKGAVFCIKVGTELASELTR